MGAAEETSLPLWQRQKVRWEQQTQLPLYSQRLGKMLKGSGSGECCMASSWAEANRSRGTEGVINVGDQLGTGRAGRSWRQCTVYQQRHLDERFLHAKNAKS